MPKVEINCLLINCQPLNLNVVPTSITFIAETNSYSLLNFKFLFILVEIQMYGTSHPKLKCSSCIMCACKTRSLHAFLLHTCICMCFLVLHHEYVRKHTHFHWITTRKTAHASA